MSEQEAPVMEATPRRRRSNRVLVTGIVILFLLAVIVYLLSLLHSKKFYLTVESGQVTVRAGIFFPWGSTRYKPEDPEQAALYAPLELPRDFRAENREFDDLPSLNRELAALLIKLVEERVFVEDEETFQKGKGYLKRAEKLQGLDVAQVQHIQRLTADVDYVEAKRVYLQVEKLLEDTRRKFERARTYGSGRFADAAEWSRKVQNLLQVIEAAKAQPAAEGRSPEAPPSIPAPAEQPAPRPAPSPVP